MTVKEDFWRFLVDILEERVKTLVGDLVFVVDAARRTMRDKDVDLRIVGEDAVDFVLGIHDGVRVGFVADTALKAGKGLPFVTPGGSMEIKDAEFFHILTAVVIAVDANFGNMGDFGERQEVFPGEIAERDDELDVFVENGLANIYLGPTIGKNESFHGLSVA